MFEQSFIRFSPQFSFSANMDVRSQRNNTESSIKSSSNINSAWASLIGEECVRLGFTVMEASQDFIPVILLTADRPPELHDAGANQAINQVNHFGNFLRYFFNLPPPGDQIYARMVLTTVDSAAYNAMQAPHGPVHINCAFREPLDHNNQNWSFDCLRGLDRWFRNAEPYTRYLGMKMVSAFGNYSCSVIEVLDIIKKAKQGLLLVGPIHKEDDMWAVALLASQLSWPVAADILSGLRMRKVLSSLREALEISDELLLLAIIPLVRKNAGAPGEVCASEKERASTPRLEFRSLYCVHRDCRYVPEYDPCSGYYIEAYLNDPEVQEALQFRMTKWAGCT